jgi:hypothetical protein
MNITIRINDELAEEIEKKRGTKPKSDFYREILEQYLISFEDSHEKDEGRPEPELLKELELKDELLKSKDLTIKTLENEVGFLIQDHTRISGQLDRLLMPAPEEIIKKNWWQFWK